MGKFITNHATTKYHLGSIIAHEGPTQYEGHYKAYCYVESAKSYFEFDDANVKKINVESVLNQNVYMLFYHLMDEGCNDIATGTISAAIENTVNYDPNSKSGHHSDIQIVSKPEGNSRKLNSGFIENF